MLKNFFPRVQGLRAFSTHSKLLRGAVKADTEVQPTSKPSSIPYNPQTLTREIVSETTGTPIPINVEINYYAPLKHRKRYGDLVAEIHLRAYDHENLEFFGDFALRAAYYLDIPVTGVIPLPTRRERWTVIRAPFVHAKSKENFLRLTHKRVIKAYDATPEVVDLWVSYLAKHSNAGVGIKVHTYQREPIHLAKELDALDIKNIDSLVGTQGGQNVQNSAITQRVKELLNDPVFKRHLPVEKLEATATEEKQIETKKDEKITKVDKSEKAARTIEEN